MIDIVGGVFRMWLAENGCNSRQTFSQNKRLPVAAVSSSLLAISISVAANAQSSSLNNATLLAQVPAPIAPQVRAEGVPGGTTILPTDVLPLPTIQNRMTFGENLQLRILQKLPARFYFTSSTETSFRLETNPFQFPTKRRFQRELGITPLQFATAGPAQQYQILRLLALPSSQDTVFRVLPSVTAGFAITPATRVYGNFFTIRDSLFKNIRLNTDIYSYGYGVQHDFKLGSRANLQADMQFRELNQMHQHSVFDFLPGLTLTYIATPRTVAYVNALLQIRGRKYFQAPTRELDPFYTWGVLHQRGRWTFSASTTFVQNFREQFGNRALIPQNNYAFISDFEIARRVIPQLPGLQAFLRAEPIWNFHSHYRPGLAGMDFRLYYGLRFTMSKPALTTALDSLRKQLEEQEITPPSPTTQPAKPSAFVRPEEVTAQQPQPIHGFLPVSDNGSEPLAHSSSTPASLADNNAASAPLKVARRRGAHRHATHKVAHRPTHKTIAARKESVEPTHDLAVERQHMPAGQSPTTLAATPHATAAVDHLPGIQLKPMMEQKAAVTPATKGNVPTKVVNKSPFREAMNKRPVTAQKTADVNPGEPSQFSHAMLFNSSTMQRVAEHGDLELPKDATQP